MAAVFNKLSIVATSPGMEQRLMNASTLVPFDVHGENFFRDSRNRAVFTAPVDKVTLPKVIGWSVAKPGSVLAAGATSAAVNTGLVFIYQNGVQIDEWRVQGASQHMLTSPTGWEDLTGDSYPANGVVSFGDGIICPAAQEISVRVTPASASQTLWRCSIWGTKSGVFDTKVANFRSYSTAAAQVALTYTPAANFTLLGYNATAALIGHVSGFHVTEFNGLQGPDFGWMGMDDTCPQPHPDSTYGKGAIWINTEGMKFFPGDRVGFRIGKNDADASEWHQFLMGMDDMLTEGVVGSGPGRVRYLPLRRC